MKQEKKTMTEAQALALALETFPNVTWTSATSSNTMVAGFQDPLACWLVNGSTSIHEPVIIILK
jgi:hypothetical protein